MAILYYLKIPTKEKLVETVVKLHALRMCRGDGGLETLESLLGRVNNEPKDHLTKSIRIEYVDGVYRFFRQDYTYEVAIYRKQGGILVNSVSHMVSLMKKSPL